LAYAFAWLTPLGVLAWSGPRYAFLFQKLDERGELPDVVHWALAFVRFNQAYYWLPAAFALVAAVAAAEALRGGLRRARRERLGELAWRAGVVCVGLLAWVLVLSAPMLPVMKMGSVVASR
jgi:hypothetical protein